MRVAIMIACFCYAITLTVLLLVPNPAGMVGLQTVPIFPWGKFGVHLLAFVGLGMMVNATRWPKLPSWTILCSLAVYGVLTETLQLWVPHRTARAMDGFEDVLGILIGTAVYWLVLRLSPAAWSAKPAAGFADGGKDDKMSF
jgi:hypothetical protein